MAKNSSWGVNKISFWSIVTVAVCYILSIVFGLLGIDVLVAVARVIRAVATAVLLIMVAVAAHNYIAGKSIAYKILYWICIIIAFAGIVLGAF